MWRHGQLCSLLCSLKGKNISPDKFLPIEKRERQQSKGEMIAALSKFAKRKKKPSPK